MRENFGIEILRPLKVAASSIFNPLRLLYKWIALIEIVPNVKVKSPHIP